MSSEYELISKAIKKLKSEMKDGGYYILAKEKIRKALNELKKDNTTLALEYLKDALIFLKFLQVLFAFFWSHDQLLFEL